MALVKKNILWHSWDSKTFFVMYFGCDGSFREVKFWYMSLDGVARPGHFQFLPLSAIVKSDKQWKCPDGVFTLFNIFSFKYLLAKVSYQPKIFKNFKSVTPLHSHTLLDWCMSARHPPNLILIVSYILCKTFS